MSLLKDLEQGKAFFPLQYLYNVFLTLSQMGNCILFFGGPDGSISGRTGSASKNGVWFMQKIQEPFIDFLLGKNHCLESIEDDTADKEIWNWAKTPSWVFFAYYLFLFSMLGVLLFKVFAG